MPPSTNSIILYITQPLSHEEQISLLDELNQPNRQYTQPLDLPDYLELSVENVAGKSVGDIVKIHKSWVADNAIELKRLNGSIFIAADEGVAPASHPRTVLVVNTLEAEGGRAEGETHQAIRVLASNAIGVITTIDKGQHGWNEFWEVAKANGGHYPGE